MQVIKEMVDSSTKARNPKISFMYLIEPDVHLGNGSQRLQGGTYRLKGTCLKIGLLKIFFMVVSSCRKSTGDHVHWLSSRGLWVKWWLGCLNSKGSMKVHVWNVPKENIIRVPFPSCSRFTSLEQPEEFENHDQGISCIQVEESPLWLEEKHLRHNMRGLIVV
jgi:hypothetical protein